MPSSYIYSPSSLEIGLARRVTKSRSNCDVLDVLGEFAVSSVYGLKLFGENGGWHGPRYSSILRSLSAGRILVKTVPRSNYNFALSKAEEGLSWERGILVVPRGIEVKPPYDLLTLRLAGWICKPDFMSSKVWGKVGNRDKHIASKGMLKPMIELDIPSSSYSLKSMIDLHGIDGAYRSLCTSYVK